MNDLAASPCRGAAGVASTGIAAVERRGYSVAVFLSWPVVSYIHLRSHKRRRQLRKAGRYLCIFFLFFSLGFFVTGVVVGVGDGVPEGSGVGDGRTRG